MKKLPQEKTVETIIIGGGMAGLSAAIYLGRAKRDVLVIDEGRSMARWEPAVQNYLGFDEPISGTELLKRGKAQARRYHVRFSKDRIAQAAVSDGSFCLTGAHTTYTCDRLLLTTGIFHLPPDIPGVEPCLGHSMFFCKDCDGYRVQGKRVAVYGCMNEAVEYALGMLLYSGKVAIVTDGRQPKWDDLHATWIKEYDMPVYLHHITGVRHQGPQIQALEMGSIELELDALFTTRGDIYYNQLAKALGAQCDASGEITVDNDCRTNIPGLYAAGCVTPANCQMIIAAGQGATAAQAINRDLFERSLSTHSLRRFRHGQLRTGNTRPTVRRNRSAPISPATPVLSGG